MSKTRDRRLSAPDGLHLRPDPASHAALRGAGHRLAVALRPPLRAGGTRLSLDGGLDPGHGAAQPHRAHPDRTHGVVQPIPSSRGAREDGDDTRPDLGRPASTRHRQRFDRGRAQQDRAGLGNVRRALRTAGRDVGDPAPGVRRRSNRFHRQAFHRQGHADQARAGPAAAAAHRRGRGRREVHAAAGGAIRRRLERAHLRARRTRAQGVGAAVDLRRGRPRPLDHRAVGRGGDGAGPGRRVAARRFGSSPRSGSGYRHSGSTRAD